MTMTMANRISDQEQNEGPTPEQARRGRRTAFLLFALGFGPMIVATIMFYTGWLNPAGPPTTFWFTSHGVGLSAT